MISILLELARYQAKNIYLSSSKTGFNWELKFYLAFKLDITVNSKVAKTNVSFLKYY